MHRAFVLSTALLGFALARPAAADIIVDQQPTGGLLDNFNSQLTTDVPSQNYRAYDDFVISNKYYLTTFRAFSYGGGDPTLNVAVTAQIRAKPDYADPILASATGTESGNDLVFNFGGQTLDPGTYWITAFVSRPIGGGGGQWFWQYHEPMAGQPVNGSQAKYQNVPTGKTENIADYTDLAFRLEGSLTPVPAPPAIVLAGIGLAGVAARRLRRSAVTTA
jgi:hypothetical protein